MRNFKVLRIDALTGKTDLLEENISEEWAFKKAYQLEKKEIVKSRRRYWFAAGNISNWRNYGYQFLEYRKRLPH